MRFKTNLGFEIALATWVAAALVATAPAAAVTLKNNDQESYQVEVIAKSSARQFDLDAGNSMTDFCKTGCVIRLNGNAENEYSLEGSERVSIEGGLVYYDGEEVAPKPGAAGEAAK